MGNNSMSEMETIRLIEWLLSKGFTKEDAFDCIRYILTGEKETEKK